MGSKRGAAVPNAPNVPNGSGANAVPKATNVGKTEDEFDFDAAWDEAEDAVAP